MALIETLHPEDRETLRRMRAKWAINDLNGGVPYVLNADLPQANRHAPDCFLKDKRVAFTGCLPFHISREHAWNMVADLGGQPQNAPTRKTDLLVVGDWYEFTLRPGYKVSLKYEKAMTLREQGYPVEIVDGLLFLELLEEAQELHQSPFEGSWQPDGHRTEHRPPAMAGVRVIKDWEDEW